jgi:hypothetical protein
MIYGFPGREVVWQHSPGAAGSEHIENGIHYLSIRVFAFALSPGFGPGKERFYYFPLFIGQVGWVSLSSFHTLNFNPTDLNPEFSDTFLSITKEGFHRSSAALAQHDKGTPTDYS